MLAGVTHLAARPEIDPARIGLLGHSEGASLAPLAAREAAGGIAFTVLMADPAVSGEDVLLRQNELLLAQAGSPRRRSRRRSRTCASSSRCCGTRSTTGRPH